ncbi:MAG: protein-glutamate O-methyltransferase CheR [Desulfobacteraceae bacterium]|nr:protein-glutamate O-methyltransferase CheR [Desulfobacteraceae bacterium]
MSLTTPGNISRNTSPNSAAPAPKPELKPIPGMRKTVKITPAEVQLFSKYIYGLCGINIEASKSYLLETRLGRMLENEKCDSFTTFYHKIKSDPSKKLEHQMVDAMTTNETLFFRDTNPFELLKHKILPEVFDRRMGKSGAIRIWSAACSTGQEIYSIAITLRELLGPTPTINLKLMGTDISDAAIKQASYGVYNKFEIERGLPQERLQRYFSPSGETWRIKDEIRSMASFQKFNLMGSFASLGKFDIIFCRNVAIYFTFEDRVKLFEKIADVLEPDGYLIIGATESLTGVCPRFVPKRHLKAIFYQLK